MAAARDVVGPWTGSRWWVLVVIGALSIVAGVIAVVLPGLTLIVLGIVFGANLLIWGTLTLVSAFDAHLGVAHSVLAVIVGVLGALAGLVCLVHPGVGIVALLLAMSFWFILTGIADLVRAIHLPEGRLLSLLLGVVGIAAGVIIVSNPGIGLATLALLAGVGFIVRGLLEVAAGLALRRSRGPRPLPAT
ncbi:MAG: HdeD family acid-resistance protein [Solirubrobacteraceae bacterium]|jgi:uncharacterized membrane protein HdeD (DUF308 family)